MVVDRGTRLQFTGQLVALQVVHEFVYLGSHLNDTGNSEHELKENSNEVSYNGKAEEDLMQQRNIRKN